MENNNSDWMAVQTQVGDSATFADVYNLGVDPSTVSLDTKATYKNKKKIKENPAFITNGKFDDTKFDQYYDTAVKTLNAYKQTDFAIGSGNIPTMNFWEDTNLARTLKQKTYKDPISVKTNTDPGTALKLAQKSNLGFIVLNQWSDPQKSIAEVAQGQKVLDGSTGKELDFTPEDNGISNAFGFFNEPLVLSAYDADIKDEKGNIIHQRGETKFDAKGLPRYETLAGRNASGKQVLSRFDTLTKEDSFINKFDYMDSDDLNKSLTGSVMKAATTLLPLAIGGPFATAAKAYFIADGLIQAGTEIGKALTGIIEGKGAENGSFYKALNDIQTFTKQWKGGTSENAKNNFFATENVLNLATDSVYQLMGQQALALWPQRVKQYQMAKELNLNPSIIESLGKAGDEVLSGVTKFENYIARYGDEAGKAAIALSRNVKQLENYGRYAQYGSRAFMAATSATGISDVADQAGLDARDKGLLYLGYTAGLAPLFALNVGHWVEGGHEVDELAKGLNAATKSYASQYLTAITPGLEKEVASDVTEEVAKRTLKQRAIDVMLAGKKLGERVAKRFDNINTPLMAGIAEGVEEITEEMLQDGVKGVYNGLSALGLTSTKDKQIDFSLDDAMSRYGQAFVGGAIGGMIFKFVDPEVKIKPFLSENLKEYVANGYGDKVIEHIKEMHKNGELPASTTLSINKIVDENGVADDSSWAPVNADNPVSQADFVADRMIKEVRANMAHLEAFGLSNPETIYEGKNKFYDTIVDTRTDTDFRDRIREATDRIIEISNDIKALGDSEINQDAVKEKKEQLKIAKEEFEYLKSDESVDEYFRQGLFNINTEINSAFGVKTRESITKELIGSKYNYATLNDEDKIKVDTAFDSYRTSNDPSYGIKADLKNARIQMEQFDSEMKDNGGYDAIEKYNESLSTLDTYVKAGKGMVDGKPTEHTLLSLAEDFYDNMKDVNYIPDFLHDKIVDTLEDVKLNGLSDTIKNESSKQGINLDPNLFRQSLLDGNIHNFNDSLPIPSLFKAYVEKFQPSSVFDSDNFRKLSTEGKLSNLSTMIKVLNQVDDIKDSSPEKSEYDRRKKLIDSLTPGQAKKLVSQVVFDSAYSNDIQRFYSENDPDYLNPENNVKPAAYQELSDMLNASDYEAILDDAEDKSINDGLTALKLLNNINKQQFLNLATGLNQGYDFNYLTQSPDEILINHALDGSLNEGDTLGVKNLNKIDEQVDELTTKIEEAIKNKATSPLAEFLANTYRFKEGEFNSIYTNGAANYLNNSDDFEQTLNDHIVKTKKVDAYLKGLVKLNPIINEWRKLHEDIVPEKLRKEELTTITPLGYGTIYQNANILLNELEYLKSLNDFNKNNTLAKLLKEDGKQLASSFKTIQKLEALEVVNSNLPSMTAFIADTTILDYVSDVDAANNDQKIAAIAAASKYEDSIYREFQGLNPEVKQSIIDVVFKRIDSTNYDFRSAVDSNQPLNDSHQTLYMAKILGTSTLEYTKAIAGEKTPEGYSKIAAAQMDPFPNQESAIRLAYLNRFGDPIINSSLATAFASRQLEESPLTFRRDNSLAIDTSNVLTIIGDPGVGKTKAIVAGILSFDDNQTQDTVLLGNVNEHVQNLVQGVKAAGFEDRINGELTNNIKDFLNDLEFTDSTNKILKLETNTDDINTQLAEIRSSDDKYFMSLLSTITNNVMKDVKLTEDNGTFNKLLAKKLKGVRNIIIDEFTHINPVDLAVITKVINAFNESVTDPNSKITITLAGDNNQLGYTVKGLSRTFADFIGLTTSIPLTTSLRSGWDVVNNTLTEIKDRTSQLNDMDETQIVDPTTAARLRQIPIKLNYSIDGDQPKGIYRQEATGETTTNELKFFAQFADAIKAEPNSLVYVVNSTNDIGPTEALLRDMLGADWKSYASVLTTNNTQGREYKYAIIDASPNQSNTDYAIRGAYKFLNTMLSRATESTLLIDKGDFSQFATWSQAEVPKAIDQKKLTSDTITKIKENRQSLIGAILTNEPGQTEAVVQPITSEVILPQNTDTPIDSEGAVPNDQAENEAEKNTTTEEPVTEQPTETEDVLEKADEPTIDPEPKAETMSTMDEDDNNALIDFGFTNSRVLTEPSDNFTRTAKYMVNAYSSLTFKRDTDQVKALMDPNMTDRDAEAALLNLKELVTYNTDFDAAYFNNSAILTALRNKGYRTRGRDMGIKIRAIKRTDDFMTVGRSKWNNNYVEKLGENLLLIEGSIPNKIDPTKPFIFTIGTFNSLENIMRVGGDTASVQSFVLNVKAELAAKQQWESPEFTLQEWRNMSVVRDFRVEFKQGVNNNFNDLRINYNKNMTITDPFVVIAKTNTDPSMAVWNKLAGQSMAFATEHAALRGMNANQLYEVYKSQIKAFNNEEFLSASPEEQKQYIANLPKIVGTNISPRPRLVQLIKLTNPKYNFIEFITNYNAFDNKWKVAKGKNLKLNEEVREFEMSTYVADRLVKSMMVIHKMLTDENSTANREWFEQNVMNKVKGNVLTQIDTYMKNTIAQAKAEGDDMASFFAGQRPEDYINSGTDATALHTIDDFVGALDKYLYGNTNLVRGIYKTNVPSQTKGIALDPNVDLTTILPELTIDKRKDFSVNGVLKVKNLAIYNNLEGSFLKLINESLIGLGTLPTTDPKLGKYSLRDVFKDGLIENIIVAGVGSNGRHINNVLAPVLKTTLASGFRTNVNSIQSASFYVNFDQMMTKATDLLKQDTKSANERQDEADLERMAIHKEYKDFLSKAGITPDYNGYNEIVTRVLNNRDELSQIINDGVQTTLNRDFKVTDINKAYSINTAGSNKSFVDHAENALSHTISDNGKIITVIADYVDRVDTTTFDKDNGYIPILTQVFKESEQSTSTDYAKRFIDSNGITKESIIALSTSFRPSALELALDLTPIKGKIIDINGVNYEVLGSSIGESGSIYDSL